MSVTGWSGLARPGSQCQQCQRRLDDPNAEAYATLAVIDSEVVREDVCGACFRARSPRPLTFWRCTSRERAEPTAGAPHKRRRREVEVLWALFDGEEGADAEVDAGERGGAAEAAAAEGASANASAVGASAAERAPHAPEDANAADAGDAAPIAAVEAPAAATAAKPDEAEKHADAPAAVGAEAAPPASDSAAKLRYLAALALIRRRELTLVRVESLGSGGERMWLRRASESAPRAVEAPPFLTGELERLSERLALALGWSAAGPAEPPAAKGPRRGGERPRAEA